MILDEMMHHESMSCEMTLFLILVLIIILLGRR